MGRGLSDLQRWILREARERGQLEYTEIRRDYFGWKPERKDKQLRDRYSPQEVGAEEYNRVMATISRSCRRLQARGLVTLEGYAPYLRWIKPTKAGRELDLG
jgi:hypothetical protein